MDFKDKRKLMQNDGKIQRRLIFVIIINIILLVSVVVLSNLTYAQLDQELHQKTLDEITNHTSSNQNPHITVGRGPSAIGVNFVTHTIYVANSIDNTVSVIDGINNKKIGDIKVGKRPLAVGFDDNPNTIYVANSLDNTVSVIDGKNNTKIGDIKVGPNPSAIGVDRRTNIIYVGMAPYAIGVDEGRNTIYVANSREDTVSVIDGRANKVVAKVMFNIEPFNAVI
jgi:YVTN family beta-propeller protein